MKYSFFIVFLFVGICHGFFGPIGQGLGNIGSVVDGIKNEAENNINQGVSQATGTANEIGQGVENIVDDVKTEAEKIVGQILNIISGIQFAAELLWDVFFSSNFDAIMLGDQVFLDGNFTSILNVTEPGNIVTEDPLADKYAQLVARLKSNIHSLYGQLFSIEKEALKAITEGEADLQGRTQAFRDKIDAIGQQINNWAVEIKVELEAYALLVIADGENLLDQYKESIDSSIQSIEQMFQRLTENLMKNLLSFVPNGNNLQ